VLVGVLVGLLVGFFCTSYNLQSIASGSGICQNTGASDILHEGF